MIINSMYGNLDMEYRKELQRIKDSFQQHQGKRNLLLKQWSDSTLKEQSLSTRLDNAIKARTVIQHVAQKTQQNLEYHISHIISLALASVWSDPYQFVVRFVLRNNKTVCEMKLSRKGHEIDPVDSAGGGVCDVVSFALQISYLLMKPSLRRTILCDEQFSFLHSPLLQRNCSDMVKTLSERTKMQIILVSGQSEITECADKRFKVRLVDGVTEVREAYEQIICLEKNDYTKAPEREDVSTIKKLKR
jgi:hypothetical protein